MKSVKDKKQTIAIIINSKAKNAKLYKSYLDMLQQYYHCRIMVVVPRKIVQAFSEAYNQFEMVLIGGGDGTIHSILDITKNDPKPIGILPLGTLNHFVREANLPQTPHDLLQALIKQSSKEVDLLTANNTWILNNLSIGFYPGLIKYRNFLKKYLTKFIAYLPAILLQLFQFKLLRVQLGYENKQTTVKTSFLMLSNNCYDYHFPATIARESINKAEIGIYYLKQIISSDIKNKFTIARTSQEVTITVSGKSTIKAGVDGELVSLKTPLIIKTHPGALRLYALL